MMARAILAIVLGITGFVLVGIHTNIYVALGVFLMVGALNWN